MRILHAGRGTNPLGLALSLIYMAVIFYLSSMPLLLPEGVEQGFLKVDPSKFSLHTAEYSVLGFLLSYALRRFFASSLVGSLYGLSDEVHQMFVPLRVFDLSDLFADCVGTVFGSIVFFLLRRKG